MADKTEATVKLPSKSVVLALFRKHGEVKDQTSSIGGDWSAQIGRHVENGNLHRGAFGAASAIVRKGANNELAALQHIDHLRVYLDWAEEMIRSRGHVGDLVRQAEEAERAEKGAEPEQPTNVIPLDQAQKAFEATAHLAPTPAEADAKTETKKRGSKKADAAPLEEVKGDTVDQFRASMRSSRSRKTKDSDVKAVADKHVQAQEERLGTEKPKHSLDDDFDELEPPKAPKSAMPDIPADLDSRKAKDPLADATGQGSYTLN